MIYYVYKVNIMNKMNQLNQLNNMSKVINRLPFELVNLILEYQGYHIWRNDKYVHRLNLNDPKYDMLKDRPQVRDGKVKFSKMKLGSLYKFEIHTAIYGNKIHWYIDKYWYYSKHPNKKSWNKPSENTIHYIFEHNEQQNLPMIHT